MPLYEYVCRACRTEFETLVAASQRDSDAVTCPQCQQSKVARKISLMAQPMVKSGGMGSSPAEQFSCGAPQCCGGGCAVD